MKSKIYWMNCLCQTFMKLVYINKEPNYLVLHIIAMNPLIHSKEI